MMLASLTMMIPSVAVIPLVRMIIFIVIVPFGKNSTSCRHRIINGKPLVAIKIDLIIYSNRLHEDKWYPA